MPATIKPFFPGRLNLGTRTRQGLQQFGLPQDDALTGRGGLPSGITAARPSGEGLPQNGDGQPIGDPFRNVEDILPPAGLPLQQGFGEIAESAQDPEAGVGAGESLFQIEIPEELRRQAEEGIGRAAGRAEFTLAGSEIAGEAGRAQRELRGQPFLQGASASGFARQRIRQVTLQKNKALQRLAIGIESKSEQVRRKALDELKAVEFLNEQLRRDFENMREREKLQAEARRQKFLLAERQFRATQPKPWWEQGAAIGLNVAASYITGGLTAGEDPGGEILGQGRGRGEEGGQA